MNPREIDHEVLTVEEICDLLQVHQSTVYKLVRQRKIPSFRVGSDWRFHRDVIVRRMVEKSTAARQVRKVIESGVNRWDSTSVNGRLPRT
jgi:excisionase family DNA binding protein